MSYYDNNNNNNYNQGHHQGQGQGEDQERGLGSFFGRKDENAPSQYGGGGPGPYGQQGPPHAGPQGSFQSGPSSSQYGQQQYGQQGPPRPGGNMVGGSSQYGGNIPGGGYSQEDIEQHEKNEKYKDWGKKAGIAALGAAAIGAVAYGVHEHREHKEEEREEEEERRRREEAEKRRHEEEKRLQHQQQQQQHHQGGGYSPSQDSAYGGGFQNQQQQQPPQYSGNAGGFVPPAPFGRPAYSFNQNDVRNADPNRSSENSPTPRQYPQLRHNDSDTIIKIGSVISLKHNMTGRFLHSDRSHGTQTGSNQQLVYGYRWNSDQNDWWQVLPANRDVPVPGSVVAYGTQIRLRHLETGRHLHSHYNFHDKSGQNEVTAYGDEGFSDENDHWVVERWGEGAYGQTWGANDVIVLRHYVSGMTLHSHEILISEDVQSVTCFGPGREENDKWRVHLH